MGYAQVVRAHVMSTASPAPSPSPTRSPGQQGLATVNPIFTWVRLAQRNPVRVHTDRVPEGVVLSAGMTATVQINPRAPGSVPNEPARVAESR
jgi:multidrug resistance efflux pump